MKFLKSIAIISSLGILLSSCATLAGNGSPKILSIDSKPANAHIVVENVKSGAIIADDKTPVIVKLEKSNGYFSGAEYKISLTSPGHRPFSFNITPTVSGAYFGNLLFGGPIGMLIVDPLTGAMWNLELPKNHPQIQQLDELSGTRLIIKLLNETTAEERKLMKRIKG